MKKKTLVGMIGSAILGSIGAVVLLGSTPRIDNSEPIQTQLDYVRSHVTAFPTNALNQPTYPQSPSTFQALLGEYDLRMILLPERAQQNPLFLNVFSQEVMGGYANQGCQTRVYNPGFDEQGHRDATRQVIVYEKATCKDVVPKL